LPVVVIIASWFATNLRYQASTYWG